MSSPYEIQKLFLSSSSVPFHLSEMISELFDPKIVMPPQPKANIFKTIFSNTNSAQLDREELCKFKTLLFYKLVKKNFN